MFESCNGKILPTLKEHPAKCIASVENNEAKGFPWEHSMVEVVAGRSMLDPLADGRPLQ